VTYTPRDGDRIRADLVVWEYTDRAPLVAVISAGDGYGSINLDRLIAVGNVELVARSEPDWQPGDIGQHIETGELYARTLVPRDRPWVQVTGDETDVGTWRHVDELAGKLRRCTVTPEVDA